jgi:hypothetical protein
VGGILGNVQKTGPATPQFLQWYRSYGAWNSTCSLFVAVYWIKIPQLPEYPVNYANMDSSQSEIGKIPSYGLFGALISHFVDKSGIQS